MNYRYAMIPAICYQPTTITHSINTVPVRYDITCHQCAADVLSICYQCHKPRPMCYQLDHRPSPAARLRRPPTAPAKWYQYTYQFGMICYLFAWMGHTRPNLTKGYYIHFDSNHFVKILLCSTCFHKHLGIHLGAISIRYPMPSHSHRSLAVAIHIVMQSIARLLSWYPIATKHACYLLYWEDE